MVALLKAKRFLACHCEKSVGIRSFSGPYSPAFGLNKDQENSEYRHFLSSVPLRIRGKKTRDFHTIRFSIDHALHEKCPNTEFSLVPIFLYSIFRIQENTYQNNSVFRHFSRSDEYCCIGECFKKSSTKVFYILL